MGDRAVVRRVGVVFLVFGAVAGCTGQSPELVPPTDGVLVQTDLPGGDWAGPFERLEDSDAAPRTVTCGPLGFAWGTTGRDLAISRSVVWVDGDLAVRTFADRYEPGSSAVEDRMIDFGLAESCIRPDGAPSPGKNQILSFTFEDVDGTVHTRQSSRSGDTDWVIETAVTAHDDVVVGVEVSYPAGTPDIPDVSDLLSKAVDATAHLSASDS